ncbi:MAG: hypothetical protein DDT20_00180 [Firmicutes bacterium]|nr:hypothetical protein [Bacillota bacterium]
MPTTCFLYAKYFGELKITNSRNLGALPHGTKVRAAGMIVSRQTPPTRSNQTDVAVFAAAQEKYAGHALTSSLLLVEGMLRKTGVCGVSITAEKVLDLREVVKHRLR